MILVVRMIEMKCPLLSLTPYWKSISLDTLDKSYPDPYTIISNEDLADDIDRAFDIGNLMNRKLPEITQQKIVSRYFLLQ